LQSKIAKNTKTLYFGVHGHSRSLMLTPLKSSSLMLVMISSISAPISNCFYAKGVNSNKIITFWVSSRLWHTPAQASLNLESGPGLLKSAFNAENFICRLSWSISSHFVTIQHFEMCAAVKNCGKFIKNPSFGVSRSFKVIDVHKSKNPVSSACHEKQCMSVPICNRFHSTGANSGNITSF